MGVDLTNIAGHKRDLLVRSSGLKASRFGVIEAPSEFWNFSRVAICPNAAK